MTEFEADPAGGGQGSEPDYGVGPWEGDLPTGDHYDLDLLREGDRRNVVDR